MDFGFVLDNNNDSDLKNYGKSRTNPYLMYSDSDISNPTMILG